MAKKVAASDVGDGGSGLCWCGRDTGDCWFPWACAGAYYHGGGGWSPAKSGKPPPASGTAPRCPKCKRGYHPGLKCGESDREATE